MDEKPELVGSIEMGKNIGIGTAKLYKTYSTKSSRIEVMQQADDVREFALGPVEFFLLCSIELGAIVGETTWRCLCHRRGRVGFNGIRLTAGNRTALHRTADGEQNDNNASQGDDVQALGLHDERSRVSHNLDGTEGHSPATKVALLVQMMVNKTIVLTVTIDYKWRDLFRLSMRYSKRFKS